jgi:hypothetical protein
LELAERGRCRQRVRRTVDHGDVHEADPVVEAEGGVMQARGLLLGQSECFQQGRQVHPEPAAVALAEAVPASDGVVR